MSGRHAMAIRLTDGLSEGYDDAMNDVCLAFSDTLVNNAGGVIAGAKPAAIFSLPMRAYCAGRWRTLARPALDEALRAYAQMLPAFGLRLTVLHRTERRVYLLVWRPLQLAEVVADSDCLAILRERGYRGTGERELVAELRRRLVGYYLGRGDMRQEFPHEIGVFLGYPAEDVRGFLEGREATCKGAWHAFGDRRAAERRFRALEAAERGCRARFAAGERLQELFAPAECGVAS